MGGSASAPSGVAGAPRPVAVPPPSSIPASADQKNAPQRCHASRCTVRHYGLYGWYVSVTKQRIRLGSLVLAPILTGATMSVRWPEPSENFYASIAQIIATLFIAMMIEFFAFNTTHRTSFDATLIIVLLAESWLGLLACIYALAGADGGLVVALAGVGVTSASILVSITLYSRVRDSVPSDRHGASAGTDMVAAVTVILFLIAPVVLVLVL